RGPLRNGTRLDRLKNVSQKSRLRQQVRIQDENVRAVRQRERKIDARSIPTIFTDVNFCRCELDLSEQSRGDIPSAVMHDNPPAAVKKLGRLPTILVQLRD